MMTHLSLYGRAVDSPFQLLRHNENGLTFALGFSLRASPRLRRLFGDLCGLSRPVAIRRGQIVLQESDEDGITDIEFHDSRGRVLGIVEAKIKGWPKIDQLRRYARRLAQKGVGNGILIALGISERPVSLVGLSSIGGVRFGSIRWVDVLSLARDAARKSHGAEGKMLSELSTWIQEVLQMQSYDREVLVRDLNTESPSYPLFLNDNVYACQPNENAEPLFFAPCFTKAKPAIGNGIHFVSRVYFRTVVSFKESAAAKEALNAACAVVKRQVDALKGRKTASDQIAYLKGLEGKWRRGVRHAGARPRREKNAVFFLGDPIRLPIPLRKQGKMVPIGFSMTLEHLMSAQPGTFKC